MPRNIVLIILLLSLVFSIYINDYTQEVSSVSRRSIYELSTNSRKVGLSRWTVEMPHIIESLYWPYINIDCYFIFRWLKDQDCLLY